MLGAARASQYAGWWSAGDISATANLTSVSSLSYARKITPTYSYLLQINSNGDPVGVITSAFDDNQYIDLTGLTGFTGYNALNVTAVQHFYLPWSGKTDARTNGQMRWDIKQSGTVRSNILAVSQNGGSGKLDVSVETGSGSVILGTPDSYTAYNDRWLTVVFSASNTASNFSNWSSSSGTGPWYARVALYDTQAGTLIGKQDQRLSTPLYDLSTLPNPLTFNPDNDSISILGYPGGSFAEDYDYRIQNMWLSMGTMFDPLTTTDTTWLTSNPNKQIGDAVAWFNSQFNDYTYYQDTNPTGTQGVSKIANTDLYVNNMANANLINARFESANANVFLTQYSNTVVLMNGGT
jgi:hypothetical protein